MTDKIGEKMVIKKQAKVTKVEQEKIQAAILALKEKLRYCPTKEITYH